MFEFLFKRQGDNKPGAKPAGKGAQGAQGAQAGAQGEPSVPAPTHQRTAQAEKLSRIGDDEAAAVEFILQCEFSELRLAAAELVHSPEQLERVHVAMRNTDRRVAKLMQSRLDAHRHREAEHRRAQGAVEHAESLLKDTLLTPNHVADACVGAADRPVPRDVFCGAIEGCIAALRRRLEREEHELFPLARAAVGGDAWFAIANQMLAHDAYAQEHRGDPRRPRREPVGHAGHEAHGRDPLQPEFGRRYEILTAAH
jgi:hypothetical protein